MEGEDAEAEDAGKQAGMAQDGKSKKENKASSHLSMATISGLSSQRVNR